MTEIHKDQNENRQAIENTKKRYPLLAKKLLETGWHLVCDIRSSQTLANGDSAVRKEKELIVDWVKSGAPLNADVIRTGEIICHSKN